MSDLDIVYLVDDDTSFLTAMLRLLGVEGLRVSAFSSATPFLAEVSPDMRGCVVMDLDMPEVGGLQLQTMLAEAGATIPVIFLTGFGDISSAVRAMHAGAADFLQKNASKEEVLAAIKRALAHDAASQAVRTRRHQLSCKFARLTRREHEVLRYVVRGEMNKQIAWMLGINERTVKLHRTAITTKVGVHSAAQLATLAWESGLFEQEVPPNSVVDLRRSFRDHPQGAP